MKYGIWGTPNQSYFSGTRLSLESVDVVESPYDGETTGGDVDLAVEMAFIAQESAEISTQVDEIGRATTALDNGETIAAIGQSVAERGNATPEEAALIQAGAAQTAEATGAPEEAVQEIVEGAATESASGIVISMEGFVEMIKRAWRAIVDFVKGIVDRIKAAWSRFWNSTASILKKAKKLRDRLEDDFDSNPELKEKDGKIKKWYGYFEQLTDNLKISFDTLTVPGLIDKQINFQRESVAATKVSVASCKKLINGLSGVKDETNLVELINKELGDGFKLPGFSEVQVGALGSGLKGIGQKAPIGNFTIAVGFKTLSLIRASMSSANNTDIAVQLINAVVCKGTRTHDKFNPKPKEPSYEPVNWNTVKRVPEQVEDLVKALEDWYNKGAKEAEKDMDSFRSDIDNKVDKAIDSADGLEKNKLRAIQRCYTVPVQFLRGSMDVCAHSLRVASAYVAYGNLMADQYKTKSSKK